MGDRAYTRFTIPLAAITDATLEQALCSALGVTPADLAAARSKPPAKGEHSWDTDFAVRLVDGCPCFVWENIDCNYGGGPIEEELQDARIPYIQANASGGEYGASSTVFFEDNTEYVPLDDCLDPVVRVDLSGDEARVDPAQIAACTRFLRLRARVLALRSPSLAVSG